MIGKDNWCIHFDQVKRECRQYASRPIFCQVNPQTYQKMFDIELEEFSDFCTFCCREQIADVYGAKSSEMVRFNSVAQSLGANDEFDFDDDDDDDDDIKDGSTVIAASK